uniref:Peptidase C2 calpain domain-containing protein n=1 Tax=Romanomermis culicivorax TaxID=13658 RepID=A0A915L5D7_ROMCU
MFSRLEIVYLDDETYQSELRFKQNSLIIPHCRIFQGFWKKGSTAGGCHTFHINPQLMLSMTSPEEVIIALLQHNVQDPRVVGFSVYRAPEMHSPPGIFPASFFRTSKALANSVYSNSRQVVLRIFLDPGAYVVVPSTYDCGQEGTFTLRVYSAAPINLNILDFPLDITKSPIIKTGDGMESYKNMFISFADENRTINAYELQELLHSCLPNDYMKSCASLDVCKRVLAAFQPQNHLGRLSFEKFKDFLCSLKVWQEILGHYSKATAGVMKAEKLREALADVGFQLNTDLIHLLLLRYMRRDGTLRFGDFVACILHLICTFKIYGIKTILRSQLQDMQMDLIGGVNVSIKSIYT